MLAEERVSEEAMRCLRAEIDDAGGNEVFAFGSLDEQGKVVRLEAVARGNENSVPALFDRIGEGSPDVFIHNHPSGFLTPSDNDLIIASRAAGDGMGAYIVDNTVSRVYVIAEALRKRPRVFLDPDAMTAALENGGSVAGRLRSYETRPSQLDLMRLIVRAFNEDALAAAEAGTGVGKSFAYLIPALSFALANNERIVISTATINLQEQLYHKDIPLVSSTMDKKVKAVLVKGRANYLCLRRLQDALAEVMIPSLGFDEGEFDELGAIAAWADTTGTGSRSDLSFMPRDAVWSRVCSEGDLCLGMRCPRRESCFFMALRRETADARILVVNHHLLFADLAARHEGAGYDNTAVLPPYRRVIIDEAHTAEGAATSFFSKEFSRLGIYRLTGRLYRKKGAQIAGLLVRIAALSENRDKLDKSADLIQKLRSHTDDLDEAALELCREEGVFRLTPQRREIAALSLLPRIGDLKKTVDALARTAGDILEGVPQKDRDEGSVWELKGILRRLEAIGLTASLFLEYQEHPDQVMWLECQKGRGREDWVRFTVTPLDVAQELSDALFKPNKTVICVSATLTIAGSGGASFAYWMNRTGFSHDGDRLMFQGEFPSPFPYRKSVLLAVPQDSPLPDQSLYRDFVDRAVGKLIEISGGSALVLFTSYEALRSAYAASSESLEKQGIHCLKQGDDDRSRLLSRFLDDESSVLFATDSFWEGVDAPGDTLRLVILCRLPFRSPSDPVFEARSEALEKQGFNPFMELSLPEAVMKFKQGFGRLMRRSSDHGIVAVLDGRLLHKRYGRIFLDSLPETRTSFGAFETVLKEADRFLY
ncbi:MAG: ATP-dependent DNA helicase DinG [Spirochaetaceae bacterium]|jgi:ATP-dependent DNA helicase DinG|nr:ATP-dependent DNA helicase DinG [Spirochaetaceae bacterium]